MPTEINKVIHQIVIDDSGAIRGAQQVDTAWDRLRGAAGELDRATLSAGRRLDQWRAKADPAFRASQRLERAQSDLDRAFAQGLVTERQSADIMDRLKRSMVGIADSSHDSRKAITGLNASFAGTAMQLGAFEQAVSRLPGPLAAVARSLGPVGLGVGALTGLAAAAATPIAKAGDEFTRLDGRLRAATGSAEAAADAYAALFGVVRDTGGSLEQTVGQFVRFNIAAQSIGATRQEVVELVDTVQKFNVVAGASTTEAAAGATQLAQALASGRLQGDELRSVMENMPLLARALARNLNVGLGDLREMAAAGRLTAENVFPALLAAGDEAERLFAQMPLTIERASGQMAASWDVFLGKLDRSLDLSNTLASVLQGLADQIDALGGQIEASPQSVADRLKAQRAELDAQLAALERERQIFSTTAPGGENRLLAPGMSGARLAQGADAESRLRERREELTRQIGQVDELIRAEQRLNVWRETSEQAAAEQAKAEAEIGRNRKAVREITNDLIPEEAARAKLQEKLAEIDRLRDVGAGRGGISEAEAIRLATAAQKEFNEAIKKGSAEQDEFGESVARAIKEIERARKAHDQAIKATEKSLSEQAEELELRLRFSGEESEEMRVQLRLLELRNDLGEDEAKRLEGQVRQVERLRTSLSDMADEQRRAEEEMRNLNRLEDEIVRDAADFIDKAFDSSKVSDFFDDAVAFARRAFAQMAAAAVLRPVISPAVELPAGAIDPQQVEALFEEAA